MAIAEVARLNRIVRHCDRMEEIAEEKAKPRPRRKSNIDLEMTKL